MSTWAENQSISVKKISSWLFSSWSAHFHRSFSLSLSIPHICPFWYTTVLVTQMNCHYVKIWKMNILWRLQTTGDPSSDNDDMETVFFYNPNQTKLSWKHEYINGSKLSQTKFSRLKMSKKRIGTADKPATVEVGSLL